MTILFNLARTTVFVYLCFRFGLFLHSASLGSLVAVCLLAGTVFSVWCWGHMKLAA